MLKHLIFITLALFSHTFIVHAQHIDSISLEKCYLDAMKTYPLIKDKENYQKINELKTASIQNIFKPSVNINAQASYQSDVTAVSIPLPSVNMPIPSKDQYKIYLDINQILFDGGATKYLKKMENSNLLIECQNIDVQMFQIKDRVSQTFFALLLLQKQERILDITQQTLQERLKTIESGIKNGILLPMNADIMNAELLKIDQQKIEIKSTRKALLKTINELTGNTFQENSLLLEPNFVASTEQNNRPELKFFDLQKEKIQVLTAVTQAKRMPKIAAFAQAGYGKPALNMFKDSFEPYYIVGARLTWNIWDWNTTRNDKQILSIQSQLVDTQKEIFSKNITIGLEKEKANLDKYKESLQKDLEIIELRTKIVRVYASQLENGTLKSSDYISELNNLTQAQLTKELHQIQLLQAQANYNQYLGN